MVLSFQEICTYAPALAISMPVTVSEASQRSDVFGDKLAQARTRLEAGDFGSALQCVAEARAISGYERFPDALAVGGQIASRYPHAGLTSAWEERVFEEHSFRVLDLCITPDGSSVISTDGNRKMLVWGLGTGAIEQEIDSGEIERAIGSTPDGRFLISAGLDGNLRK